MNIDEAMAAAAEKLGGDGVETPAEAVPETTPEVDAAPAKAEPAPEVSEVTAAARRLAQQRTAKAGPKAAAPKVNEKAEAAPKGDANGAAAEAPATAQGRPAGADSSTAPAGQPAAETPPAIKAPQSWTPAEREAWAKAPPEIQRAVERREKEIARALQESAPARHIAAQVQQTLAPYETIARANGMDAMSYAGSVLQTAAVLHMGTPAQKAQAFATLIQQFQPDLDAINAVLQGQAPAAHAAPQPQDVSRLVQQELERARAQERQAKAKEDAEAFLASSPEFLDDVKDDMLALMQAARSQGRNMSWPQAYDAACKLNEGVQTVLAQRKAAAAVRTPQPVTERAKAAASSVRSTPAAAPAAKPRGLDGALNAAREKLGL